MYVQNGAAVPAGIPRKKPSHRFLADTAGQLLDEKSSNQLQSELDEKIEYHFRRVPLSERLEKAGNGSLNPSGATFTFSRLGRMVGISYADFLMPKARKPIKLNVIWETVPDPDLHALLKAVAMLFNRRVPLSTGVDLTKRDEELMCRRLPEP